MHQTRNSVSKKIPIPRKGTKYVARSLLDKENSVPVLIAIRDMLKLARTAKEVKAMIKQKQIKINNKLVKDIHNGIRLFSLLQAGKTYILTLTPTGRFSLKETKDKQRYTKVTSKKALKKGQIQLNLHDGTNLILKDAKKINVGDTVYLDENTKLTKHVELKDGKSCFIMSGAHLGKQGKIKLIKDRVALIDLKDQESEIELRRILAL